MNYKDFDNKEIESDVFNFIDELRESGVTNMFGATPYIANEYDIDSITAKKWLLLWMASKNDA